MAGMLSKASQADPGVRQELENTAATTDFTAPGEAVDPNAAVGAPLDPVRGMQVARDSVNRSSGIAGEDEQASEAEQKEYERVLGAVETALYSNEEVTKSIIDQIQPQDKIGSVVKVTLLFFKQIDERIDMDEIVVPQIVMDLLDRIIELAEQVKGITFSEKELQAITGAAWEGVMEMFGIDESEYEELTQGMGEQEVRQYEQQYQQFLGGQSNVGEAS